MKRNGILLPLVFLLVLSVAVCCAAETGPVAPSAFSQAYLSENPPTFTEDSHPWAVAYRSYFLTQTTQIGSLTFSVEKGMYEPEQAIGLLDRVLDDLRIISDALPVADQPLAIYAVEATLNGVAQQVGDAIYCTVEDILEGSYRPVLIATVSDIPAYWKAVGLSGVLFEQPVNATMLRAHYEQADDLDILSLFPAYYLSEFASEEEMHIASETAVSLADYIIDQYGMNVFVSDDRVTDRQEWLHSLGVDRDYSDSYAETLGDYRYDFLTDGFPLLVTTDKGDRLYMRYMEEDLDSPAQVRAFLYEANVGIQAILDGIERDAPEYLETVLSQYQKPIALYFEPILSGSWANSYERKIELGSSYHYLHEMSHILVNSLVYDRPVYDYENWKYEAIAQYLDITYYQAPRFVKAWYDNMMKAYDIEDSSDPSESAWMAFDGRVREMYKDLYGDLPEEWMDFNIASAWKAMALTQTQDILDNPEVELEWIRTIGNITHWRGKRIGGNELTYMQAYAFGDYLIGQYGLSTFLRYCFEDTSFEEAFNLSYEDAKEAWLKHEQIIQ